MGKIKKVVILFLIASFSDDQVKLANIAPQENSELIKSGIYEKTSQNSISSDALPKRISKRPETSCMRKYRGFVLSYLAYLVLILAVMMLFLCELIMYPIRYMKKKFINP